MVPLCADKRDVGLGLIWFLFDDASKFAVLLPSFYGFMFLLLVELNTRDEIIPVHSVTVKFRTIHADKLGAVVHGYSATTTHTGSIYHNGVQADGSRNGKGLCGK